jgi:hypothetical protein
MHGKLHPKLQQEASEKSGYVTPSRFASRRKASEVMRLFNNAVSTSFPELRG